MKNLVEARSSRALRTWFGDWLLFSVQEQTIDGFQWISKLFHAVLCSDETS